MTSKLCLVPCLCLFAVLAAQAEPPSRQARRTLYLSMDDLDQRIVLAPKEAVTLQIANAFLAKEPVTLSAPSGGNINGGKGHAKLESPDGLREVTFAAGAATGLYVLEIKHGKETRTVEFWVGPASPIGRPGPVREINRD